MRNCRSHMKNVIPSPMAPLCHDYGVFCCSSAQCPTIRHLCFATSRETHSLGFKKLFPIYFIGEERNGMSE